MIYLPSEDEMNKQRQLIGEFIIEFEQICGFIRFIILDILYPNASKLDNNNVEILLEGLTADPLRKKLESLIFDNYNDDKELINFSKEISKKFESLISIRNSFAHGSILLGRKNLSGESSGNTFLLKHSKTTKEGIDRNSMIIENSNLEYLIEQTRDIYNIYSHIILLIDKEYPENNRNFSKEYITKKIESIGKIELKPIEKLKK